MQVLVFLHLAQAGISIASLRDLSPGAPPQLVRVSEKHSCSAACCTALPSYLSFTNLDFKGCIGSSWKVISLLARIIGL